MINRILYESCPICKGTFKEYKVCTDLRGNPLSIKHVKEIKWMMCEFCNHVFTDGYFSEEDLSIIFKDDTIHKVPINLEPQRETFSRLLDKVIRFKDGGRWLDVGFGDGSLLATAKEYGFDVVGLDLRSYMVDSIKKLYKIEAHCTDLQHFDQSEFEVVSMLDVIEHLPYPEKELNIAYDKMEPNGLLIISTPNRESIVWDLTTEVGANPYWGNIEHYHCFTRTNLYDLLGKCGFKPLLFGIGNRYRCTMEVIALRV